MCYFFFFKQKTAYEISACLVGSEMCIRDSFCSEILVSADGKFVYVGNRLHDSIGIFSVGPNGDLTYVGEEWTRGNYPRSFSFEPSSGSSTVATRGLTMSPSSVRTVKLGASHSLATTFLSATRR